MCQSLFRFPRGLDRLPIGFPARRVHTLLRFTYRGETIRIIAQAIGVKASPARTKSMKKKTVRYTNDKGEIIGELRAIPKGELPSLDQLVGKQHQKQKVTLALDGEAISFFKREASKRHTSYQRMIRNLVLAYARQHAG